MKHKHSWIMADTKFIDRARLWWVVLWVCSCGEAKITETNKDQ